MIGNCQSWTMEVMPNGGMSTSRGSANELKCDFRSVCPKMTIEWGHYDHHFGIEGEYMHLVVLVQLIYI